MGHNLDMKKNMSWLYFYDESTKEISKPKNAGTKDVGGIKSGRSDVWIEGWTDKPKSKYPSTLSNLEANAFTVGCLNKT